jgi:peptide/nickel transport system permease protein
MAQQSETSSTSIATIEPEQAGRKTLDRTQLQTTPGFYTRAWRRFRKDRVAMVALALATIIMIFSFGAPVVSNVTGYTYYTGDLRSTLLAPGEQGHVLGTDANGRDIMVRLAYGGRTSMMVAVLAVISALTIGAAVGSIAGFYGGFIDTILMRFVDVIISIPGITILLLLSVWFRPGPVGLAFVIAGLAWTGIARLVRGEVLTLKNRDYIDAARVLGATNSRIITRHIFPNVVSIIIVWMSLALPALILYEATLSYLGFGVRIPQPSWGNMLDEAKEFYRSSWTYVFIPGFAIYLAALSFNLIGNGLRDALDPRLNE